MTNLETISVICGGQSPEHAISWLSARSVVKEFLSMPEVEHLNLIVITEQGEWKLINDLQSWMDSAVGEFAEQDKIVFPRWGGAITPCWIDENNKHSPAGVVFPLVHGCQGEDGKLPGLLSLMRVPFVGADVIGSAACINKIITKRLLEAAGLFVAPYIVVTPFCEDPSFNAVEKQLGVPFFVKTSSQGSSVGVYKVENQSAYESAMQDVRQYGDEILLEQAMSGREIECAVLYDDGYKASLPGEIICPEGEVYSYESKYSDDSPCTTKVPANLPESIVANIQKLAIAALQAVHVRSMARVDGFFDEEKQQWVINELNTIPGFTSISLYPQCWAASGLPYADLLRALIKTAMHNYEREKKYEIKSFGGVN